MYNNIFYSRAVDSKDNFRICGGVEASRKMAGHDLRNQRLIQAAGPLNHLHISPFPTH